MEVLQLSTEATGPKCHWLSTSPLEDGHTTSFWGRRLPHRPLGTVTGTRLFQLSPAARSFTCYWSHTSPRARRSVVACPLPTGLCLCWFHTARGPVIHQGVTATLLLKLAFFALWRTAPTAPCPVPARSQWRPAFTPYLNSSGSWRKTRVLPYCTSCKPHWHQLFGLHNDQHVVPQPACEAVVQVQKREVKQA